MPRGGLSKQLGDVEMDSDNYANKPNPGEEIREQGYAYILYNNLTGKRSRLMAEYDEDIEDITQTYQLHIITWEEQEEEPEISWE